MLRDCIPYEFSNTKQLKELFEIEQKEIDLLYEKKDELYEDLFISTTNNLINRYLKEYEIPDNKQESLIQKRARIIAKKNRKMVPIINNLEKVIKELLIADDVVIKEGLNKIFIYVKTPNLLENMYIAKEWVHKVRPAHIGYDFINELLRSKNVEIYFGVYNFTKKISKIEVEI